MTALRHYWDAPTVPPTTPAGATVVVRSRCGRSINVPVWRLRRWASDSGAFTPQSGDCPTCTSSLQTVS